MGKESFSDADAPEILAEDADRVLARAARIGGVAFTLFGRSDAREAKSVSSCGKEAAACRYVSRLAWGRQACRRSRERALALSIQLGKPAPFICHMGFACAVHALTDQSGNQYSLVAGPYCPAEAPDSLEHDALEGLRALAPQSQAELPFKLDDIPTASAAAVPELVEWTAQWLVAGTQHEAPTAAVESTAASGRRSARPGPLDPYQAADIAAALAGGNQDQARAVVKLVMSEGSGWDPLESTCRHASLSIL